MQGSSSERSKALNQFFDDKKLKEMAIKVILKRGGNLEDAQDAFQDASLIFIKNIIDGKFRGDGSLRTYFIAIVHNRWFDIKKSAYSKRISLIEDKEALDSTAYVEYPDIPSEKEDLTKLVKEILSFVKERDKNILFMWLNRHTREDIARELGLKNEQQARKAIFRSRRKLRKLLMSHPDLVERIKEARY